MWLLISCIKHSPVLASTERAGDPLSETLLLVEEPSLEDRHRRPWPHVEWDTASVYGFNHEQGENRRTEAFLWHPDTGWSDSIDSEKLLTKTRAELSVELVHRGGGSFVLSKCPIVPHHGIVYFSEGRPVASWSVCFECGDALTWPPYYPSKAEESERYRWTEIREGERVFLFDELQGVLLEKWKRFFAAEGVASGD